MFLLLSVPGHYAVGASEGIVAFLGAKIGSASLEISEKCNMLPEIGEDKVVHRQLALVCEVKLRSISLSLDVAQ